jgi:hypothetical protein
MQLFDVNRSGRAFKELKVRRQVRAGRFAGAFLEKQAGKLPPLRERPVIRFEP